MLTAEAELPKIIGTIELAITDAENRLHAHGVGLSSARCCSDVRLGLSLRYSSSENTRMWRRRVPRLMRRCNDALAALSQALATHDQSSEVFAGVKQTLQQPFIDEFDAAAAVKSPPGGGRARHPSVECERAAGVAAANWIERRAIQRSVRVCCRGAYGAPLDCRR